MCITKTVGIGGSNDASDVRSLQLLLNMNDDSLRALLVDGRWGPRSGRALAQFQDRAGVTPQRRVAPEDQTLDALRGGLPTAPGAQRLWAVMIEGASARIEQFHPTLLAMFARYRIDTPLRRAHFLAQTAHETACLRYLEELASGAAYEGRRDLGNGQPGDGPRFKGRGLIHLTGRANYRQYGQACGRDFEQHDDPGLVGRDPFLAVDVAGWFWTHRRLNALADQDDLRGITRRVNGGFNGLAQRTRYLARAKWLLL